ncbi:hypothetical protein BC831DRAFT_44754 [Entophlyctis helioformis]|nr:hypothetical protein BC831DRAFT_44754 [Entophlyctis helioformis]
MHRYLSVGLVSAVLGRQPFVGIRGDFQGIETTTTGVTYVGGRFTVDAVPAPVSLLSLTGPSSSAAFKPVMLGPATPLTINGRILAMRTSLNGSLYIVSVRDMDAMVILSAYDGALYSTVPLGTRAVITDMTPMRWMSSNSSRGQIDGMLLVGRLPLTSTPDAVMYAAVLFDPADGTLAPYAVSTAGGLVTRVRVAGGIPMRVLQHDGEGPAGLPGWAIALIVIACIVSAVVIGWMIYVIITGETSRQSRAAAHDSRDSLGSFSEKPPTSRRGSRLHPSPLTMPSPLTSPASPTSPMHYSGIKHSSFTWSAPDLKAHHAAHSPSTPTSATHLAHSSFDDITVIDPIHRPPRPPVIGYQEYQQRLHSHSRQQQQQQDLEDDIADAVSNNVNANANINANANTNANHDHDDDAMMMSTACSQTTCPSIS